MLKQGLVQNLFFLLYCTFGLNLNSFVNWKHSEVPTKQHFHYISMSFHLNKWGKVEGRKTGTPSAVLRDPTVESQLDSNK